MKTSKTLLLASVVTATLTYAGAANAGDVAQSPRGKANQITHVRATHSDPNLVSGEYAGAANRARGMFHSMVASEGARDINLVSGNYPGAAAKDPNRELHGPQFKLAPLIQERNEGAK